MMIILRGRFLFLVFLIGYVCLLQTFECLISRDYLNQLFNNGGSGEQCRERPIEENFLQADIIITGTVKSLERNASRSHKHMTPYSAQIQIHRIIKGYDLVFKLLNINVEQLSAVEQANKRNKLFAKRTSKLSMNGNLVTVRNFGEKSICESNVKPHDVRIFPLRVDVKNNNQLYLSSSLIKVKSGNVKNGLTDDNVRDNTKYVECSRNISNICNYGSMCLMDKVTNLVTCECDMNCDPFETMSLCGSDSVTYKNLCHLKQSKCLQQRAIKIVNHDTCEQLEASLCKSKNCPFYGKCKIDESGFYAKCVCPDECDLSSTSQVFVFSDYEYEPSSSSSGPSSSPSNSILNRAIASSSTSSNKGQKSKELITNELFSQIVCGSDGVDYKNFCQLKKESCQLSKEIKVYYFGKCNPCNDITCVYPKICRLNSNRQPECTCDLQCHNSYKPVCASNGKTYMNECFMNLESCRLNRPLRIVHNNDCSYTRNPCDQIVCDQYIGSYCEIDQQGRAFCKCEEKCEKILNYVCGSDGVTYENECNLRRESCMSNQLITVQHLGICGTMNPCVNYPCNFGGTCELVNNIPTCKCVECSEVFVPVCGTDGMTYSNICKLRRESCMKRALIEIEYDGICDRCKSINCPFYGTCIDDGLETKCVCQETCADIFIPTCGSDGVTYNSVCHLQLNSCKTQKMITVLHNGNCDPCMELKCEKTTVDYVCGSDGVTHANECYLNMTACISKTEITVRHKGICPNDHETNQVKLKQSCQECQFNAECIFFKDNSTFMCSCSNFDCSNEDRNLLCGSNGKVYENKCELEKDMCLNQREIKEQPLDNCLGDSIVCDGYTPLINFQSQLPYTCRSNRDCPSESFCDQHHLRCCSKKVNHIHTGVKCKKNSDCNNENMLCIANDCILISNCLNTTHGCCPDGYTPAKGKNGKGCPKFCNCHPAGSYNQICDERTGNCHCRPGVVGKLCDSCAIGYWGIKKILDSKYIGCLPCSCNKYGSLREDCNQEDGRCECKPGVFGIKCTECLPGQELTPDGCVSLMEQQKQIENLCANLNCNYPGAYCSVDEGIAKCICDTINCISDGRVVCGEDGQTYASECDLIKFSCAKQTEIPIAYFGKCTQGFNETIQKIKLQRLQTHTLDASWNSSKLVQRKNYPAYGTQKCLRDYDCGKNMECLRNICYCIDGFFPENDYCVDSITYRAKILYPISSIYQKRFAFDGCKSQPCALGSYCENLSTNNKFICHCPLGKYGFLCEKSYTTNTFPSFKDYSFLELSEATISLTEFNIQLEFKSTKLNGTILFAYQYFEISNDFLLVSLKNGHIELRIFSNGDLIKFILPAKVQMGKYHRVHIRKKKMFLTIQLDDLTAYQYKLLSNMAYGSIKSNIILGNIAKLEKISNKTIKKMNISTGFEGCIQHVKINQKMYNLSFPNIDILNGADINECPEKKCTNKFCQNDGRCRLVNDVHKKVKAECVCKRGYTGKFCEKKINACLSSPCLQGNLSQCIPTAIGNFQCVCSDAHDGLFCEKQVEIKSPFVAQFNGRSYIERKGLNFDFNSIDIVFYSEKVDGLLLYNGEPSSNQYLGIKIVNTFLHFEYLIDGKFENLISREPIFMHKWNRMRIVKISGRFRMILNSDTEVSSSEISFPKTKSFNESLFIGGIKDCSLINKMFKLNKGLVGAIQKVNINNVNQKDIRKDAIEICGIERFEGFPCNQSLCENNGVCIPALNNFKCKCLNGFRGKFCQKNNGRMVRNQNFNVKILNNASLSGQQIALNLDGHTELFYKNRIFDSIKIQKTNKFEIKFKTKNPNGLLLYTGVGNLNSYLLIALINGKVVFTFSLPKVKRVFSLSSTQRLNDNSWHTITVERNKRRATLTIDHNAKFNATFDEANYVGFGDLVTDGYLRVGGYRRLPFGMTQNFYYGFKGCVSDLKVDDRIIDLIGNNLNTQYYPNLCSVNAKNIKIDKNKG